VTCDPKSNRERWPALAKVVEQMRTFDPAVSVVNIYEKGQLVAGRELGFQPDPLRLPKCACGCIEPFCNCPPNGEVISPTVRSRRKRFENDNSSDLKDANQFEE
jgi:hypothetical protein